MLKGQYPTAFPLKHQQKDLRLALQAAGEGSLELPVAAAANSLYLTVSAPSVLFGMWNKASVVAITLLFSLMECYLSTL